MHLMTSYPRLLEGMLQAEASVDKVRLLFGAWFPRLSLPHPEASGGQHRSDSLAESVEPSSKDFFSAISNIFLKGQYRSSSKILSSRNLSLRQLSLAFSSSPMLNSIRKPRSSMSESLASMMPDAFFRRGVSVVAGVRISDPEKMSRILKQGGSAFHLLNECCEKTAFVNAGSNL
jgi:hypothetical protein